MNKLFTYLKESRAELMKVAWPSRQTTRDHTIMVVAVSLGVALFLGAIDFLLEEAVQRYILSFVK